MPSTRARSPTASSRRAPRNGGILSKQDFAAYTRDAKTSRCAATTADYELISAPPPSSGGTAICQILNILEGYPMAEFGFNSSRTVHVMAEAMRHAFVDRNFQLGDPGLRQQSARAAAVGRLRRVDPRRRSIRTRPRPRKTCSPAWPPHEGTETTHYSIVDDKGQRGGRHLHHQRAVRRQGDRRRHRLLPQRRDGRLHRQARRAQSVRPRAGQDQCHRARQAPAEFDEPDHRDASDGKVFMVLGSPGGSRIITIVLQVFLNVVDHGMTIQEAVNAPRIHHQWLPDQISVEPFALSADTQGQSRSHGPQDRGAVRLGRGGGHPRSARRPKTGAESSGNDAAAKSTLVPGLLYGGHDDRRPAGRRRATELPLILSWTFAASLPK